jgi:hypothetical protein
VKALLRKPAHLAVSAVFALPILVWVALSRLRADTTKPPRVVWGPVPIISIKYWSAAIRKRGLESTTVVYDVYSINTREDFDRVLDRPHFAIFRPYLAFVWVLRHADVVNFFFDGGFLAPTPLRWLECPLLRTARKRIVLSPYGSDVAVTEFLGPFRQATIDSTPQVVARSDAVRRRVDHFSRWGDFIVRNVQPGYLPRWDLMWPTCVAIDTAEWQAELPELDRDSVVVVHSANHPALKGTAAVVAAVSELQQAGMPVELDLLHGVSNQEVHRRLERADIVAEQFLAGYGLAAIEGLACGKPVLAHMRWLDDDMLANTALAECPIIDTSSDAVASNLRPLILDPELRRRLGAAGREYVERHHSYDAVGRVWDQIFRYVWSGGDRPTSETIADGPA